uniref:Alternative protein PKHD1L1 n=1 Tax=Homo sapiens TaxID=9606 RepID=L8E9A6_HUMAN|nr:alternative protein PKHD1L1 [Homo sapiens]
MGHPMTETFVKKEFPLANFLTILSILKVGLECGSLRNISPCKRDLVHLQCLHLQYLTHLLLGIVKKELNGSMEVPFSSITL